MEKKYCRANAYNKLGELLPIEERTFITNERYECIIINGGSKQHHVTCTIEGVTFEARAGNVRNGEVAYLLHKSMCGVGYTGYGIYLPKTHRKAYVIWGNMLNRCYSEVYLFKYPTYKEVSVHPDWYNFQNFARWFYEESNFRDGWELDKDLLSGNVKVYSTTTCIFLPKHLNTFIIDVATAADTNTRSIRLRKDTGKYSVRFQCKLVNNGKTIAGGCFDTEAEAIVKLNEIKNTYLPEIKYFYKDQLPESILDLL